MSPEEARQRFSRDGYVIVRGLASAGSCAAMKAVAERELAAAAEPLEYETDVAYPGAPPSRAAAGGRTVRRLLQAYARAAVFREWATSLPLREHLQGLLGARPCLSQAHHNCIMTKNPRYSSVTGWHRDIRYWSYQRPELVSAWLALGPERADNGCLSLLPGSHVLDLAPGQLDENQFLRADAPSNRELLESAVRAELAPGDLLLFHCRLFHAAGRNTTADTKFSLVFTYHAEDNLPVAGSRSASVPSVCLA
jgi:phytanoyl-CoA hydroxylase